MFGKVQIIKTFAISQFVLPASLLVVPDGVVKQIESLVYKFLWRSRDKIKRLKTVQDVKLGGLKLDGLKGYIFLTLLFTVGLS